MKGKKFVASYSGGKDSILAIYRAIRLGMIPVSLIITYNTDMNRSWFHGIPEPLISEVSKSLNIPIQLIRTSGEDYAKNFEKALILQKEAGAEVCVFGDIDLAEHREWCTKRCENAGLEPFFPLWNGDRKQLVYEFIDNGFTANITVVDTKRMDIKHLGQVLTKDRVEGIEHEGADPCGENGEYHSFVSNGPIFLRGVDFSFGEPIMNGQYAILPISK